MERFKEEDMSPDDMSKFESQLLLEAQECE